jgi:hypothetical protein
LFVPDDKFTGFVMQNIYGNIYKRTKALKIVQAQIDLPLVKEDFKAGMEGAKFIDCKIFGYQTPDQFILNKDLDTYSITSKDMV